MLQPNYFELSYVGLSCVKLSWSVWFTLFIFLTLHWFELNLMGLNYIALYCIFLHCTELSWSFTVVGFLSCLKDWYFYCIVALHLLHCIALHCIAVYCIALYCIVLHFLALHCIVLKFHSSMLPGICLKDWEFYYIVLHCIAFFALHCIALGCLEVA